MLSQAEIFSEIASPRFRVIDQFIDGSGEEDFPLVHEVAPVDNGENFPRIVIGDQNADLFPL